LKTVQQSFTQITKQKSQTDSRITEIDLAIKLTTMNKDTKKPLFPSQILKDLTIVDCWLTTESLVIQHVYNGQDYTLSLTQDKAIDLLKKYGIIEDHKMMDVKVCDEDGYSVWVPWYDFAINYTLTETDAREIICGELSEDSLNEWAECVKSIPDVIKRNIPNSNVDPVFQSILNSIFPYGSNL
jgi:hypothetical protein